MLWSVVEREVAEVVRFGAGKQTSKATDHTSVLCQTTATPAFNHWHSYGFLPGLGVYCRLCENHRDCDCFLCAVVLIVGVVAQKISNGPTEPFHRGDLGIAKARLGRVV
jgi:hypothetical protein